MHNRFILAGTNSGCGKTTVMVAVLSALVRRGLDVSSFKCGPDYIDPMFHRSVLGVTAHNLDPFFCGRDTLLQMLNTHAGRDISLVEGVMGYYDGIGAGGQYSTCEVAQSTGTPAVLVLNARGMSTSAGAILEGFIRYRPDNGLRGVIFNNISTGTYPMLAKIAEHAGVQAYGYLPKRAELSFESRHLGLVTAGELNDLKNKVENLGVLAEKYIDLDGLLVLAGTASHIETAPFARWRGEPRARIAVAKDAAFCFLYRENLELLESLGCQLIYFSPCSDAALPERTQGLYLPGGYPELHAAALSGNTTMRTSIRTAVLGGLPTIAECGGFLYLHAHLDGVPMVDAIAADAYRTERLQRFGYVTLVAQHNNLLGRAGENIRGHEFHYWDSTDCGDGFSARKAGNGTTYACVHATPSLYAGFPHLYLPSNPVFAKNFVEKAVATCN
ncbi:MAG: cobyrinate a,c-diamide synthase [Clostridia bacterium]